MRLLSPAKINLHLRVGPTAPDGFHPILSWMCTTGLADVLEFNASKHPAVQLTCDRSDLPVDGANLIIRAAAALSTANGAAIHLTKRIPMGGGLGGGSSNAAFTLLGLNQLWNLNLPTPHLAQLGAKLGSDVPFFFHGPSSICTSRGEQVHPIPRPRPRSVLMIFPKISMPTPAVYKRFDELKLARNSAIQEQPPWTKWSQLPARDLLPLLVNDLEPPAFSLNPALGEMRASIQQTLGRIVRMSGSGSTLFTLFDDPAEAQSAANTLNGQSLNAQHFELTPPPNA